MTRPWLLSPSPCLRAGATVDVDGAPARVVPVPFATRSFAEGAKPPAAAAAAATGDQAAAAAAAASLQERAEQAR